MKKLDWVLLVDDDIDCNFFHQRIIKKMDCTDRVYVANDGVEALDFIKFHVDPKAAGSAVIFLDLNMPRLNGWEFLEEYEQLKERIHGKLVVVLLTSSFNPDDRDRAGACDSVDGFLSKSLTKESLTRVLQDHFPEYFQHSVHLT